jgi:hypothetical protein
MRATAPLAAMLTFAAVPAWAGDGDLFGRDRFTGVLDLRLGAADGEATWLDGGYGKARIGGNDGALDLDGGVAEAGLIWSPRVTWSLDGYVHAQFNEDQGNAIDLVEAFARWKSPPRDGVRFGARAGIFYPPVSLEHVDAGWSTRYTITPSAINSWIGEEVKVAGGEASAWREIGGHELGLTLGAFGRNDLSGTILSWRGWAMHDVKAGWDTAWRLPDGARSNLAVFAPWQAPTTEPSRELDGRIGFYGRADWRAPEILSVNVEHYDNAGNLGVGEKSQFAWETRFTNLGLTLDVSPETIVVAQAMMGETLWGRFHPWRVDMGFSSAFVLANHEAGPNIFTARAEWFETRDRTYVVEDDNNEDGWALTFAYGREIAERQRLMFEAMQIDSDRPSRAYGGVAPEQEQTVLQASWRIEM